VVASFVVLCGDAATEAPIRLLAIGNLISITGTWMQLVAQNLLVLRLTGSTALLGACVALQAAPSALGGLFGGVLADRVSRRELLVATQLAWITLTASVGVLVATGTVEAWMLLGGAVVSGLIAAVEGPANAAFTPELVPPEDLPNAIALGSAVNGAGRVLGMALAGVVIAAAGTSTVFLLNALSFVGVLAALRLMRTSEIHATPRAARESSQLRSALRYLAGATRLRWAIVLAFWLSLFGRNFQVTIAAMTEGPLGVGAGGYGVASTAFALGALVGAVFAARFAFPALRLLVVAGLVAGALQTGAALAPGLPEFVAAMVPIAAGWRPIAA